MSVKFLILYKTYITVKFERTFINFFVALCSFAPSSTGAWYPLYVNHCNINNEAVSALRKYLIRKMITEISFLYLQWEPKVKLKFSKGK